jgi:hypothetical protein
MPASTQVLPTHNFKNRKAHSLMRHEFDAVATDAAY